MIDESVILYKEAFVDNSALKAFCVVGDFSRVRNSKLEENCRIDRQNFLLNVEMGKRTYTGPWDMIFYAKIGAYCSISYGVTIGAPEHNYRRTSTHPFIYDSKFCVATVIEEDIHFETSQFRDIVEDLEISHAKNMKRIETNPYQDAYKGPDIILRVLYKNMMGQWFESELAQELLELRYKSKGENERGKVVTNKDVANGDVYYGCMINPCYSHIKRRMVCDDYVKEVLKECGENAKTSRFEIDKCV